MTTANTSLTQSRWLRPVLIAVLVATLVIGALLVWPSRTSHKIVGYFESAVSIYPGDQVRIVGVPVAPSTRSSRAPTTSR